MKMSKWDQFIEQNVSIILDVISNKKDEKLGYCYCYDYHDSGCL